MLNQQLPSRCFDVSQMAAAGFIFACGLCSDCPDARIECDGNSQFALVTYSRCNFPTARSERWMPHVGLACIELEPGAVHGELRLAQLPITFNREYQRPFPSAKDGCGPYA